MPATFAAYVPFPPYIPPTKTATQQQTPAHQIQTQGLTEGGIIILICLAGFLFLALTDRR